MLQSFIVFLLFGLFSGSIIYYGWKSYKEVLSKNPCEMTYSYAFHYENKFEWKSDKYRLLQVSPNPSSPINPHPVLFIPGHLGR
jgi:hypothetical protein